MDIIIQVKGFEELARKVSDPELLGAPLREFWNGLLPVVVSDIQTTTPVDIGNLRASFQPGRGVTGIDSSPLPLWAQVGSNLDYAPYVESGTPPHWTSWTNLNEWAYRHNTNVWALQRAIARRGTRGHHMVMMAAFNLEITLPQHVQELAQSIESQWGKS